MNLAQLLNLCSFANVNSAIAQAASMYFVLFAVSLGN